MEYTGSSQHLTLISEVRATVMVDEGAEEVKVRARPDELALLIVQKVSRSRKDPSISFETKNELEMEITKLKMRFPTLPEDVLVSKIEFDFIMFRVYMSYENNHYSIGSPIHREILDLYAGDAEEIVGLMIQSAWKELGKSILTKRGDTINAGNTSF